MPELKISPLTAIRDLRGMRRLQGVYTDAIDVAIAALEKQVKKQPRRDETIGMAVCPRCGWPIDEHKGFQAYCELCGQRLKWEDEK